MNAAAFTSYICPPAPADPRFDASCDCTAEWREISCAASESSGAGCFEECDDTAEALFISDWEQEPVGADDVGGWVEVFELVGLRITDCRGAVVNIGRKDAIDALGIAAVRALEREMIDRNRNE